MRILIHGLNFSPELTGIGKYTGEMAEWLVGCGHELRVVTAPPYYPQWRMAYGYANGWSREEARREFGCIPMSIVGASQSFRLEACAAFGELCAVQFPNNDESNILAARCGAGGGACAFLRTAGLAGGAISRYKGVVAHSGLRGGCGVRSGLSEGGLFCAAWWRLASGG